MSLGDRLRAAGSALFAPEAREPVKPAEGVTVLGTQPVAWSESVIYRMADFPKYNPDDLIGLKGAPIYKKMMGDEQVKAVVKFKRAAITSRRWRFDPDEAVELSEAEWKRRCDLFTFLLRRTGGSFRDGMNAVMRAPWQGYSLSEKVFSITEFQGKGYMGLKALRPRPFDTFYFHVDEYGDVLKVQQVMPDGRKQDVDLSRFVYYVHNPDMDEHYGRSELREAYRAYFSKDIAIRFHNMFMERMASGFLVVTPDKERPVAANSQEHTDLVNLLKNLSGKGGILLPAGVQHEVHFPTSTDQFEKAVVMHNLAIAKSLLVPNLLGLSEAGQTGAYAQSQTQLEAFMWTLEDEASRLEETLQEQLFDELGKLNFEDGHAPRFRMEPLSNAQKMAVITQWKDLVTAGAVEPSDTDEEHLRETLDMPAKGAPLKKPVPIDPTTGLPINPLAAKPGEEGDGKGTGGTDDEDTGKVDEGQAEDDAAGDKSKRKPNSKEKGGSFHRQSAEFKRQAVASAEKRVAFAVIDRSSTRVVRDGVSDLEKALAKGVAALLGRIRELHLGTPQGDAAAAGTVGLNGHEKRALKETSRKAFTSAWGLGEEHAQNEIDQARGKRFTVDMARLGDKADKFLEGKAFTTAGKTADDVAALVRTVLANGIKGNYSDDDVTREAYLALFRRGYLSAETISEALGLTPDELAEAAAGAGLGSLARLETAVRTGSFDAMNQARMNFFTDPALGGFVQALQYSAILDDRTTDICQHLDGRVYPAGDDVWDEYNPPNHFNCRSLLIPVTELDAWQASEAPTKEPQEGFS